MALPHAQSSQVISIRPLGELLPQTLSHAIIKAGQLELIRVVLRAGEELREHDVPGELTLQCLEGEVLFDCGDGPQPLVPGNLLHLRAREPHAIRALQDSSLLLTICLVAA